MNVSWDPDQYGRFSDERSRPFFDLLAGVPLVAPRTIVDLGCGSGDLTRELAKRWPGALVIGIDNSPEMLARARQVNPAGAAAAPAAESAADSIVGQGTRTASRNGERPGRTLGGTAAREGERSGGSAGGVSFQLADISDWRSDTPVDLIVSNAALHWLPDHERLVPELAGMVAPDGILAVQMPGNFDAPSHRLIQEVAGDPRWAPLLAKSGVPGASVRPLSWYAETLTDLDFAVDAWETTYLHLLRGPSPVLEWIRGTALRPILDHLPPGEQPAFLRELDQRLISAYPRNGEITSFPFRRLFIVARRPSRSAGREEHAGSS